MERLSALDRQVQILAARPFSLMRVEKAARVTAADIRRALDETPRYEDGSVLVFGADPEQRRQERQRRIERINERVRKAEAMEVREKMLHCLRLKHGDKASLLDLDLAEWETHLLGGLLKPPTEEDNSLNDHREWLVRESVVSPYTVRIFRAGRGAALDHLIDAMEIRNGEDAETLVEEHLTHAILDELVPEREMAGEDASPTFPLPKSPA